MTETLHVCTKDGFVSEFLCETALVIGIWPTMILFIAYIIGGIITGGRQCDWGGRSGMRKEAQGNFFYFFFAVLPQCLLWPIFLPRINKRLRELPPTVWDLEEGRYVLVEKEHD